MNTFKTIFAALAATAALVGCSKEIAPPSSENDKVNPEGSRVIAVSFAPQTKTELDGFQPKFVDNDSILISNGVAIDTCDVEVEGNVATISTNLTGPLTAVYPYKAAGMSDSNPNQIDTVLVSTEQDGTFASANICMTEISENATAATFENKTAVFCIKPAAGASSEYVEVKAEGFNIANNIPEESAFTDYSTIRVPSVNADSVYVSILALDGLKVNNLKFSDGTKEKTITTGARATEEIAAGTLYTVTNEDWASPEADIPEPLNGKFSVSADKQVQFSKGNLYCSRTSSESGDWTWHFYDEQYKYNSLSTNTSRTAQDTDTEIDLFTWGYGAWSTEPTGDGYQEDSFTEWGSQIGDGTTWRTLTKSEWQYLFSYDASVVESGNYDNEARRGKYKCGVTVCGKTNCVVLLPDDWNWGGTVGDTWQDAGYSEETTVKWSAMEAAGAVCLPAAGVRTGSDVSDVGDCGSYWSSTGGGEDARHIDFDSSSTTVAHDTDERLCGFSVRLVTDVSAAPGPTEPDYVVITAKYDGEDNPDRPLKWSRQNLAITDSGNKKWKGENDTAVKVPGTNEDVIVGDYFQWAAYAGYCGNDTDADKGLLIYDSFTNNKCVDGGSEDSIALKSAGGSKKYRFSPSNTTGYTGISPYFSTGYQYYKDTDHSTLYRETSYTGHSDDVANIILGGDWRMPTSTEFKAIREATYWAWDGTDCGYYVFKPGEGTSGTANDRGNFNATNDEKSKALLFFPAAGYGDYISLSQAGSSGRYWSSTLSTDNIAQAYYLLFKSDDVIPQRGNFRFNGCSIRPVSD